MTKLAAVLAVVLLGGVLLGGAAAATGTDWPSFGDSVGAVSTGITVATSFTSGKRATIALACMRLLWMP